MTPRTAVLALALTCCAANPAGADDAAAALPGKDAATANDAALELNVPESPAFAILGISPQEVIRPTSPRQLATHILQGVDPHGNLQSGIALDMAPYLFFFGNDLTLKQYQNNYAARLLARTQLSAATAKGTSGDDKAIRVGLGLRVTPWDLGDPRNDQGLLACFANDVEGKRLSEEAVDMELDLAAGVAGVTREAVDNKKKEATTASQAHVQTCWRDHGHTAGAAWNDSSWALGVAPAFISETGAADDLKANTASLWTSFAYGFEGIPGLDESSQLVLSGRYNMSEAVADQNAGDGFRSQDTLAAALQLRVGVRGEWLGPLKANVGDAPNLILNVEGDYLHTDPKGAPTDSSYRLSAGLDVKLPMMESAYLHLAAGSSGGGTDDSDQGFVQLGLRTGFGTENRSLALR